MALTYQAAVEQTITAGEQIHQIVNGTATTEVTVEDGSKVPSIRKALLDNFYFKDPIAWQVGQTENVFNQLRQFTDGSWWYAPSATAGNPISMGSTPVGDPLWKIYDFDAIGKLEPRIDEALRRSYAEAGYSLIGRFSNAGLVVNTATDVVLWDATGIAYAYSGTLPHTIGAGETPVGNPLWLAKAGVTLRTDLAASGGAGMVGLLHGTVEKAIKHVTPEMFDTGGGVTATVQAAINYAGATGQQLVMTGLYDCDGLTIPSNLHMYGNGYTELRTSSLTMTGSFGAEINLTVAANPGDNSITVASAAGLAVGDSIRIISCINSNSDDAGIHALGARFDDYSYFAEYAVITGISGNVLTLSRNLLFPYPLTPSAQSGVRTISSVRKTNFVKNITIENIHINGGVTPSTSLLISGYICKDVVLRDCFFDNKELVKGCVDFMYSENVVIENTAVKIPPYQSGSAIPNNVKFRSSQSCSMQGGSLLGGSQQLDITYVTHFGDDNFGGPSIDCGAVGVRCEGSGTEGLCDHPGCYGSYFERNFVIGNYNGIRIRSKKAKCVGNVLVSKIDSTKKNAGIRVSADVVSDSVISGNIVEGFYYGASITAAESTIEDKLVINRDAKKVLFANIFRRCYRGMYLTPIYTANRKKVDPILVTGNCFYDIDSDGIVIDPYFNGIVITNNTFSNIGSTVDFSAAINVSAGNLSGLIIRNNQQFNSQANTRFIVGPATTAYAPFITDTTTFPGGDADARLCIENNATDAVVPSARMILSPACYIKQQPMSGTRMFSGISNVAVSGSTDLIPLTAHTYVDEVSKEIKMQIKLSDGTSKVVILGSYT